MKARILVRKNCGKILYVNQNLARIARRFSTPQDFPQVLRSKTTKDLVDCAHH